ncbi:MAG: hypothetical protein A2009_00520 [Tenericutes bacterium GWD2_38_27]|nr:MAG: hypothetical protein A2Y43_02310 [Tenericutes bacterium GWA2_38_26]OHE32598.1 MAG: hypothetical protein A2009_00520 [Tenericutes bacterium GWD2_38_27]
MKSFLFYVTVIILVSALVIIIKQNEVMIEKRVLTVAQYYSYRSVEEGRMEVPIYLNEEKHPLSNPESYLNIYFSNLDESKKIEMPLKDIQYGHVETYLNGIYHQYLLMLELPYLDHDFLIEDLYMHIELINMDQYSFYLGSFSLVYLADSEDVLDWTGLNGSKEEHHFLSRLKEIYIDYETMVEEIDRIEIGVNMEVLFTIQGNRITLDIPVADYLLNDVPIIIYYANHQIQIIDNFRYLVDYQILKESGPLINLYALN